MHTVLMQASSSCRHTFREGLTDQTTLMFYAFAIYNQLYLNNYNILYGELYQIV